MTVLRFVIAFKIEAEPLIEHYVLSRKKKIGLFPVYGGDNHALVLSGLGSEAAAGATDALYNEYGSPDNTLWLNIGVAGHTNLPLGTVVLANRIINRASGEHWPTVQPCSYTMASSELITVSAPENHYLPHTLYDMEAAGFYTAARQYAPAQWVQCLKVVSDNKQSPLDIFSTQQAGELMQQSRETLLQCINTLTRQETS